MTVRTHTDGRHTVVTVDGTELARTTRPRIAARLVARLIDHRPAGYLPDGRPFDLTAAGLRTLARIVDDLASERIASLPAGMTEPCPEDAAYDALNYGRCSRCGDIGCRCDAHAGGVR